MTQNWSGFVRNFRDFFQLQQDKQQAPTLIKSIKNFGHVKQTPTMKFLPTYRLEPKRPVNKEVIENILKSVITRAFEDFQYESKAAQKLAKIVSEDIKFRFKACEFERFRIISVVTIGEKYFQGYNSMASFLWDPNNDGYVNFTYDTPQYFVVATLYYVYYN